jgi:tRNA (guanosine-2'-O-)-methyltransferase
MERDDADATAFEPGPVFPPGWDAERVIAFLEPMTLDERRTRLSDVVSARIGSVTLLFDAPHDPHNGAAVLRSCDAFGIPELHVIPRQESFLFGNRVAKGSQRWVDVVTHATPELAADALHARGFCLVAAEAQGDLVMDDLATLPKVAIVLGNEHDGLCEALRRVCDRSVRIPMRGFVESLNVSVAAGVLLAAATRGRAGDLSPEQRRHYYARWLVRSVPRAEEILRAAL